MAGTRPVPDRYRRLQLLGEGGVGQVWLVEDSLRPGARLALKEPLDAPADRSHALRREYVILARLRHPGLVEVFELDRGPTDGLPRFTLEYVDGESLSAVAKREGSPTCLSLAAEALRVLDFLHDFGFVHRDLKPDNLLVRKRPRLDCRLVLLDLGLAVSEEHDAVRAPAGPAGTLPYMAPELFAGSPCTPRSDLYGLGALLYEVVHGRPPHLPKGDDLNEFVERVREGRRVRPRLPEGYPEGFSIWIEELLSPEPGERPAGAREALARLNVLTGSSFPMENETSRAARLASDPPPGRDEELAALRSSLDPDDGPRVVWLTGGPGSGKSRLLRWLRWESILLGWNVVAPFPGLQGGPGDETGDSGGDAVLRKLREEAARQPTLLLLDDVEAADGRTVRLLDRVARQGRSAPVQVVAALRPGEVAHPLLRRLLEQTGTVPTLRRLELGPLDQPAIRAVAERATGSRDQSDARLRWLARASEGSPQQVESLLVAGSWEKQGRLPRPSEPERQVRVRMASLSEPTTAWMESLAVMGPDAHEADLAALCDLPAERARQAAEEARLAGLAVDHEGRWSPVSRAVSELFARRLEGERRVEIHRRAAELLSSRAVDGADSWRLARLWSGASRPDLAVRYAVQSARRSLSAGDPAEASVRFAYALRHCPREAPERFALRVGQAEALMEAGHHQAAGRAFGAALRLSSDPALRAELLGRQAHALVHAGRFSRAERAAEEALELAVTHDLALPRAQALKARGIVLGRLGREGEAIRLLEDALDRFRRKLDAEMEAETLHILAVCKSRVQREGAEDDFQRAITIFRELERHGAELKSLIGLAVIQIRGGKLASARKLLDEARSLALRHGNLDLQETALSKLASLAIEEGRLDEAISIGREALDLARHLGDENRMMIDRCRLAEALVVSGLPAEAVGLLRDGLGRPLEAVEPDMADYARMLLAQALLESPGCEEGDVRPMLELSQRGFRERRKARPLLVALALEMELVARLGSPADMERLESEFHALVESSGSPPEPEIRLRADLARCAAALRQGDPERAAGLARQAAELARDSRFPVYEARALASLGKAVEQTGKGNEARELFARARRLLEGAAEAIEDRAVRDGFLERGVHGTILAGAPPRGDERRLIALYEMIRALNSETDPDALLETILDMALRVVTAERGMILLRSAEGDAFSVRAARNLERETEADATEYSRSIVARAGAGRSILALKAGEDARFRDLKSVSMYGIRSLMCVPLRSRAKIIGTVYLDSRKEGAAFTQEDLRFVEAFADHAALALQNARERADLQQENERLRAMAESRWRFGNLVGRSEAMQRVFDLIEKVAASDLSVLVQGESGTGKELVARAIHFNGPRRRRIILSENCAAIPETLLESELFGHVRGAFTGAERDRQGLFEQADGGTLFLDEVGDMSPAMQAKLLRVLQEGEIRRVGGDRPIRVDVRVIAATNRDLAAEVRGGRFREDLLYRLQVLAIQLPPLRDRPEDIPLLIDHFRNRVARERGREPPEIDPSVRRLLERCSWPGNVRQLESALQRLILLSGDEPITRATLDSDDSLREALSPGTEAEEPTFSLDRGVKEQLRRALTAAGGHRERAAKLLGISRATLYRKLKEHGVK